MNYSSVSANLEIEHSDKITSVCYTTDRKNYPFKYDEAPHPDIPFSEFVNNVAITLNQIYGEHVDVGMPMYNTTYQKTYTNPKSKMKVSIILELRDDIDRAEMAVDLPMVNGEMYCYTDDESVLEYIESNGWTTYLSTLITEAIDPNLVLPIDKVAKYFAPVGINFFLTTTEQ